MQQKCPLGCPYKCDALHKSGKCSSPLWIYHDFLHPGTPPPPHTHTWCPFYFFGPCPSNSLSRPLLVEMSCKHSYSLKAQNVCILKCISFPINILKHTLFTYMFANWQSSSLPLYLGLTHFSGSLPPPTVILLSCMKLAYTQQACEQREQQISCLVSKLNMYSKHTSSNGIVKIYRNTTTLFK